MKMKFLCDQMLGTLAKWLRLYGFDTYFTNGNMKDDELLHIAKKENRIIITRDKELILRGKYKNLKVIEISSTDLNVQIRNVLHGKSINNNTILSRCSICNTILKEIKKNEVYNKVPAKIYENNEQFWFCYKCDKIYWIGSHYKKIINKINEIKINNNY